MQSEKQRQIQLEVCVETAEDAFAAAEAGANRIELNLGLTLGGLSPSLGLLKSVCELPIPIICMVRPRAGNFLYASRSKTVMLRDLHLFLQNEAAGIACGVLDSKNQIDVEFTEKLRKAIGEKEFVFHRAFDEIQDQNSALQMLIDLGVDRVLTSGGEQAAIQGIDRLKSLMETTRNRIEILPGSGINSVNVKRLIESTQCDQVHGSFQTLHDSESLPNKAADTSAETPPRCCPTELRRVREIIDTIELNSF